MYYLYKMIKPDYKALQSLLSEPKKIAIIPHRNPDGDAIGSTLALQEYLSQLGHESQVVSPNQAPDFLHWMPGFHQIINFERQNDLAQEIIANAQLIFTLDFNHLNRVGDVMQASLEAAEGSFVMIDHHEAPDSYALHTYSDTSICSTCQMVYHFIEALEDLDKITAQMATCLYTGMMTDTGSFKYASTTATTHQVAAALIHLGAKNAEIHQAIYDNNSPSRLHLLGCALQNMEVIPEYKTAIIHLSQKELDQYGYKKGDTEGLVNYGLSIAGVVFSTIFIENTEEQIIKISFRSQGDFSVNEFARAHFNGGGHHNAAGGKSDLSLSGTIAHFKEILPTYKNKLNQ
ncbi:MAG: Bifunctional oligoribonuclease and PAP phosphatase NrnA [SAR116 cluster bacterium]|nr:MAG: Bifunctional oligoribonuclease and PAP phosphatase NrnA [SAR116 cluster bacterium]